jgi:hypothetical protein
MYYITKIRIFKLMVKIAPLILNEVGPKNLAANGKAIGAVSVTGEAIRLVVPVVSKPARMTDVSRSGGERVPVASRYGAVFAITVREGFITITVQGDS